MTDQLEMFATPPSVETTPRDDFDAAGAALRLRVCHEWTMPIRLRPHVCARSNLPTA